MPTRVRRHPDARSFLDAAEPWLLGAEDENNLLLGIARSLLKSRGAYGAPIYLATVEEGGRIQGCAFRTPPFKLGLTRLPARALPALVADVAAVFTSIPAVLGPNEEALAFADLWAADRGVSASPGTRQRIYSLARVQMPDPLAPGHMRPAAASDLPVLRGWVADFLASTGLGAHRGGDELAEELVKSGSLVVWVHGEPVAMAGFTGRTQNTIRVSYVYTPALNRKRGYASALVAHLSRTLLDSHARKCVLYTDLSNPTSNSIYRRMGYHPVCDVMDVGFQPPG